MSNKSEMTEEARMEKSLRRQFPLYEFFGLEVQSTQEGVYRCFVPHRESNLNHIDTIHAGIQWSVSEVLGGMVMISTLKEQPFFAVVKRVVMDFTRPARSGITAEAFFDAKAVAKLKSDFEKTGEAAFSLHVRVLDQDGTEVASAVGDYLARKPREK
jgi:uncharacterized protein (TIGR00369 family)